MDNKRDEDDEDDTFIVEEDPALQNFLEVVSWLVLCSWEYKRVFWKYKKYRKR